MFVVLLKYIRPLEDIEAMLPRHVKFLDSLYAKKKIICSGRQSPRTGGVILLKAQTREEAKSLVEEDPFFRHGLAQYELIEFLPTKFDPDFARFVD